MVGRMGLQCNDAYIEVLFNDDKAYFLEEGKLSSSWRMGKQVSHVDYAHAISINWNHRPDKPGTRYNGIFAQTRSEIHEGSDTTTRKTIIHFSR